MILYDSPQISNLYKIIFIDGGCRCAGKNNQSGEGAKCRKYYGYPDEWYNGRWCYAESATCLDASQHPSKSLNGYGASRLACATGNCVFY